MQLKKKKKNAQNQGDSSSIIEAFRKIIKEEGVGGVYKGIGSKLSQSVLTAALLFWGKVNAVSSCIVDRFDVLNGFMF